MCWAREEGPSGGANPVPLEEQFNKMGKKKNEIQ